MSCFYWISTWPNKLTLLMLILFFSSSEMHNFVSGPMKDTTTSMLKVMVDEEFCNGSYFCIYCVTLAAFC